MVQRQEIICRERPTGPRARKTHYHTSSLVMTHPSIIDPFSMKPRAKSRITDTPESSSNVCALFRANWTNWTQGQPWQEEDKKQAVRGLRRELQLVKRGRDAAHRKKCCLVEAIRVSGVRMPPSVPRIEIARRPPSMLRSRVQWRRGGRRPRVLLVRVLL